MTADEIIRTLALAPHPEGGWYRETWKGDPVAGRPVGTAIYFLLQHDEESRWHRVDAAEIWLYHAGAPLALSVSETEEGPAHYHLLTPDLEKGRPQFVVPPHHWQTARSTGDWTLVSCTVAPGFDFDGFTLAPHGFDIPRG